MKCKCCGQEIREPASKKFDEFWQVWPTKVKRKESEKIWKSRKLDNLADTIIANVRARISDDPRWQAGYIPNPTTYLRGDLWEDEIDTQPKVMQWPTKNEDWEILGREHKIYPGIGEGWPQFKARVQRATG